jgi:hypothetical protein
MPSIPLGEAGPYVAAAYLVFLGLILVYVGIMAAKLARIERQAVELNELLTRRDDAREAGASSGRDDASARDTSSRQRVEAP